MASQDDVRSVDAEGKVAPVKRFDKRDFDYIAEFILQTYEDRKKARADREKHWADIDRQVAMEPNVAFKKLPNGEIDAGKKWMSEIEPPLQAQTLEVCTADARRFMFAGSGPWFRAHAEMSDDYLGKVNFGSLILGDSAEVPSVINQDNADKLVEGFQYHQFAQYDFASRVDRINAEVFKYGMGVARARMQGRSIYIHEANGIVRKERQRLPVLVPCSIKKLYLDDPLPSMHTSEEIGPGHIAEDYLRFENIALAAARGSNDPDDEDGGWMPANFKQLIADDKGYVTVLEYEGDLIIPRKTVKSMVLPGVIVTVAKGGKDKGGNVTNAVIRLRWRKSPYSSYLLFPYHFEGADGSYASSPLEKGRPLQITVAECLNRLLDSAALQVAPPVGYDRSDTMFAQEGGPRIHPYAVWASLESVVVHDKVGGDQGALVQALTLAVNQYAELTGVLPGRLGAQTVSHTTAFAKDAELSRGAVRTIDYVNSAGQGPMTRWLGMSYDMGRRAIGKEGLSFFSDAYGGYVQVSKDDLPERAAFEWFGSGGPSEEQAKAQRKLQSLQLAIQMDNLKMQQDQIGASGTVNIDEAIRQVLRDGGWTDVDAITNAAKQQQLALPAPQTGFNPGAQSVALQQIGMATQ